MYKAQMLERKASAACNEPALQHLPFRIILVNAQVTTVMHY